MFSIKSAMAALARPQRATNSPLRPRRSESVAHEFLSRLLPSRPREARTTVTPGEQFPLAAAANPRFHGHRRAAALCALLLAAGSGLMLSVRDIKTVTQIESAAAAPTFPDEIVVDFNDGISFAQMRDIEREFDISLRPSSRHAQKAKRMIATIEPARREEVLGRLRQHPLVEAAEKQFLYGILETQPQTWTPNDPYYSYQWHLQFIGLEKAWTYNRGLGAKVAVLDTGVGVVSGGRYQGLRDFGETKFIDGYDFVDDDAEPQDEHGHGTHVAGTIGESTDNGILGAGVAPEAGLMMLRVLGNSGSGRLSAILDAIGYAADHGANVINMSLGGGPYSELMRKMLAYAVNHGALPVCAAGNSGRNGVEYPARFAECLAVSSVGPSGRLAPYSTWGPEVDLAGPGGDTSAGPGGGIWQNSIRVEHGFFQSRLREGFFPLQGTSMAAPHVSGVAALLVSAGQKDPAKRRFLLRKSARGGYDSQRYGAGILDAGAALAVNGEGPGSQNPSRARIFSGMASIDPGSLVLAGLACILAGAAFRIRISYVAVLIGAALPWAAATFLAFGSIGVLLGHSAAVPVAAGILYPRCRMASLVIGLAGYLGFTIWKGSNPFNTADEFAQIWLIANCTLSGYLLWASREKEMGTRIAASA